jgi:hypothetical protein
MTSQPYSETSQPLDGLGVSYEELLFYEQHHLTGKRVRSPDELSPSGLLTCMEAAARSNYVTSLW